MTRRVLRDARVAVLAAALLLPRVGAACEENAPAGRVETDRRGGAVAARRVYDEEGALLEESFFDADGRLSERRTYVRSAGGRLERIEARDAEGALVGTIAYRYDASGRLVGLSPASAMGSGAAGMIASGPAPSASWVSSGGAVLVQRFDDRGRPVRVDTLEGGKVVARALYAYGEGPFPSRSVVEDLNSGTAVASDFDADGRISRRVETSKGGAGSQSDFRYDGAGRLVEERSRIKGSLVERSLEYGESGTLEREETRIDGVISEAVVHAEGEKVIERYHDGLLFVRSRYRDGRKVKDEFYEGGAMIRSKEYR